MSGDVPLVVSTETAGLGNRIKSWVSAMRLGERARVYWPLTPNMPTPFEALFVGDWALSEIPPEAQTYMSWRLAILPEDEPHLPAGFATVGGGSHPLVRGLGKAWWMLRGRPDDRYQYMVFPKSHSRRSSRRDARHIDLEYGRIPQYFRDVYGAAFARIEVQPTIAEKVAAWAREQVDEATVGVQVRTWRDDPRRHRKYYLPSVRRLERLLDAVAEQSRILVVSDSDDVAPRLQARYGRERIVQYPRSTPRHASWQTSLGVEEDLIDMLLLARTQTLFASYLSTFGEVAWWLGGTRARVSVF